MEDCQPFSSFRFRCVKLLRWIFVVLLIHLNVYSGFSQQPNIYNQFFMNPYLYNPAYAGVEGHTVLFLLYHQQWSNFEGAPTTAHGSFHTPLKGGIGIGAAGYNLQQGILNRTTGKVSASYLLSVDRKHHFRFGLSVGGGTQTVNFGELDDPRDPAFLRLVDQNAFTIADFGMTYHFDHFNVGFAIPNLVGYNTFEQNSFGDIRVKPLDNLMIKANYRGHINDDIAIEPHIIYRYSSTILDQYKVPDQFEATVIFHIYHVVWLGATYRQDNNFAATFGTKIKEKLGIGLSYEVGNPSILGDLGPTYEVNIGYHIGTRKEHAEHVSSFIKSHRLTAEERAEQAAREREEKIKQLQASRPQEPEEQEGEVAEEEETTPPAEEETPLQDDPVEEEPEEIIEEDPETTIEESLPEEEPEEIIATPIVEGEQDPIVSEEVEKGDTTLTDDFRTHDELAGSNEHLEVTRGNNMLELPAGNYVIAGAFEEFQHAEDYSDELFQRGYHETIVGYLTARGYYYTVIFRSDSLQQANAARNRYRTRPGMDKIWVLKVNE